MADAKISDDPQVSTLSGAELIPVVQSGVNKNATLTQVMEQLASRDFKYTFSTNTAASDPGTGVFKFNNATIGSVTVLYLDISTSDSKDLSLFLEKFEIGGRLIINSTQDNSFAIFDITSVADSTGYYTIGVNYIAGSIFSNNEVCSLMYYDAAEPLAFDTLADPNCPDPVGNDGLIVVLNNCANNTYGRKSLWISNNTEFEALGQAVIDCFGDTIKIITANNVTWTASDNGGKVRLTTDASADHGLSGIAVGCYLHVKTTQNNWVANQLHKITAITTSAPFRVDLDTDWNASYGVPVFSIAGENCQVAKINIPALGNNSQIIVDAGWIMSNSANNKTIKITLSGTDMYAPSAFTTTAGVFTSVGIINKNSKSVQESRYFSTNTTGSGASTGSYATGTVDTSVQTYLEFIVTAAAVNEFVGLRNRAVRLIY